MITIVENAWKIQRRIEKRLLSWKKHLSNNTLFWRQNDLTIYFLMTVLFFSAAYIIMIITYSPALRNCVTDYWLVPVGIGEVFLFLFTICKKVDNE